ncbi:hypothetical protein VTN31DRAFT_3064 [Thermomyces dupontii]|uniref:uncharacterized protein n=1 Tax=Talaromyces thermophilus TaxID=28565 RepID=UPI0037426DA2
MAEVEKNPATVKPTDSEDESQTNQPVEQQRRYPVKWYRSSFFNALILGVCNFLAPGIWGAMNSLGGGGNQSPFLVNAANSLTFCLMVLSCFFGSLIVKFIGIKWTFILGTTGYAPYAAGLYVNNRYGTEWLVLFGAAVCGLAAGIFWMAEAAIALAYPEPYNQGRFLGFWLSFRVAGQILGGAINVGLNAQSNKAGKVSYSVFQLFIALQALCPVVGFLLSSPKNVQRTDGLPVRLHVYQKWWTEIKAVTKLFFRRDYLLIIPLICQSVYAEAVMFTFQGLWFSVRARALGSFLSGVVALISGNILGAFLDSKRISLKSRARWSFAAVSILSGMCWLWGTVIVTEFRKTRPVYDWSDPGFGRGFALFLFWVISFQLNYMYLYFVVGNLAENEEEVVRIAGLLRGTESAAQAVSYGLSSVPIFAEVGGVYLNYDYRRRERYKT